MLSYGRMVDSKGLKGFPVWSNWPIVPEIVPGIAFRRFAVSFGECLNDNIATVLMAFEKTRSRDEL